MLNSKVVFAKRKEGELDEAYQMALQLVSNPQHDSWDLKAFAWCLIDLVKREAKSGDKVKLHEYQHQLEAIDVDSEDKILTDQKFYTLKLCQPGWEEVTIAKALSKEGKYQDAVNVYNKLIRDGDVTEDAHTGLAWDLYRLSKELLGQSHPNFNLVKRHLNSYFQLQVEKPSLLHTCFLMLADKIAKENKINMGAFVRYWDLNNLRSEDFHPYTTEDGTSIPSLAERVIQHAAKDAYSRDDHEAITYILPFISKCIYKFPENIWLQLSKARSLMVLGRSNEALEYGLEVAKFKVNDYWVWELLGDLYHNIDQTITLSCYCKALACSKDINFLGKVKLKLAVLLIAEGDFARAKKEVEEVANFRVSQSQRVPELADKLMSQGWYQSAVCAESNMDYYRDHVKAAEGLLHANLPWIDGVLGESFTTKLHPQKPRRKLYIKNHPIPVEAVIPETKLALSDTTSGLPIKLKAEVDASGRYHVYAVELRDEGEKWDVFDEYVGVIDHVNHSKNIVHFIVNKSIDGLVSMSDLKNVAKEGDLIAVRVSEFDSKQGKRTQVVHASMTDKMPPDSVLKRFEDVVEEGNGMGFTTQGIFIPPPLMAKNRVEHMQRVSGLAVINFNKKRGEWGWKALLLD